MPNRILSGEIARSDSLSRVSLEAEVAFVHLISQADDFGRFDGRPAILLAQLFPTRMESVSLEALGRWLRELEGEGLISWYEVEGRRYVEIPSWSKYQRTRAQHSKYPAPLAKAESDSTPLSDDSKPLSSAADLRESYTRDERREEERPAPPVDRLSSGLLISIEEAFRAYGKHPRQWNDARKRKLRARLGESSPDALVQAVHGYAWMHRSPGNGFDPSVNHTPETIYRPENFAKYLDAWHEAVASGAEPPFRQQPRAPNGSSLLADLEAYERAKGRA